ncbi:hypothetical protein IVB18_24520 [Bradyrhizobium sp. 186]|uniref:hypothetical protein n=1 Tax=Bradyrhizobium sp. 186 TaxID=2782654 RepID=UPI002001C3BB|nr:hypothetical protein [Bradyrhizobium sp. 186]UPK40113.1 hypothetical protein IVB18_24520 [Bradyrhizobium sp. 186]
MKFGTLQRIVADNGFGRLWLVDAHGVAHAITRKALREAGVVRPSAGDAFEFLAANDGEAVQLRKIAA